MKASQRAIDLIKQFEGCRFSPYLDQAGVPTIGYGSTYYPGGNRVTMQDEVITEQEAEELLMNHCDANCQFMEQMITYDINQNQVDALCSFCYNVGIGNLKLSTLLKKINLGDIPGAAAQFLLWDRAGGEEVDGLLRRRNAERELFLEA